MFPDYVQIHNYTTWDADRLWINRGNGNIAIVRVYTVPCRIILGVQYGGESTLGFRNAEQLETALNLILYGNTV